MSIINNNECPQPDYRQFDKPNSYKHNKNVPYALGFTKGYKCPRGYSILGNPDSSNECFKTIGKTNLEEPEKYDELSEQIKAFDNNKKYIKDEDYINSSNKNNPDVHFNLIELKDRGRKFIVKSCPNSHPDFLNENVIPNKIDTERTQTTTSVTCNYDERIVRELSKKDVCITPCGAGETRILCGNGATMEQCEDNVYAAVENCKRTVDNCWRRIHAAEQDCFNRLDKWYIPPCFGNDNCIRGLCNVFVNKIGGEVGCGVIRLGCAITDVLGRTACAFSGLGPKICGKQCPPGFISEADYILRLSPEERRRRYNLVLPNQDNSTRKELLRPYQYQCIRVGTADGKNINFKLCNTEREIEIGKNTDIWDKHCSSGTKLTDDSDCLDAAKKSGDIFSMFKFDAIYLEKCKSNIDINELLETTDPYGVKKRNKFSYEFLAKKLTSVGSEYRMNTLLPIINVTNLNVMDLKELAAGFERLELILDIDITFALMNREFDYKLEAANCSTGVKAYRAIFSRLKFANGEDDCCLNRTSLLGESTNYYQSLDNDSPVPGEPERVVINTSITGSLESCQPNLRKLEGGGEQMCQYTLEEYCNEPDETKTPRVIAFSDNEQTNRKYKRCSIDLQKKMRSVYDGMVREICNDYKPDTGNPDEAQNFLKTNKVCQQLCKEKPKECEKGMLKYCTLPYGPKGQQKMNIFEPDCQDFFKSRDDLDKVMELRCVKDKLSPIYNDSRCITFRNEYEKCLINNKYMGTTECKKFYEKNPNITAKKFNDDCNINPQKKYCNVDIIQKDIYGEAYKASSNKKLAAMNIKNSDAKAYSKTSEKYLIDNKKILVQDKILEDQVTICLRNKKNDNTCQNIINKYMGSKFENMCVLGNKDAYENIEICNKLKNTSLIDFNKTIEPYCDTIESAVYDLPYCQTLRYKNRTKKLIIRTIIGIFILIISFIIFSFLRKNDII